MSAQAIRDAGKEAEVRTAAAHGDSFKDIANRLKSQGLDVTSSSVKRFIRDEAAERRTVASGIAADESAKSIALVTSSLVTLLRDGMALAERCKPRSEPEDVSPDGDPDIFAVDEARRIRAWTEVARTVVVTATALRDVTAGHKPVGSPLTTEQLRSRVREIYGIDEDAGGTRPAIQ